MGKKQMTDRRSALRAVSEGQLRLQFVAVAASVVALSIIAAPTVQAKQQCSVAAGPQGYWSWRVIEGRKCWYEGKPMLSKSSLEWPAQAAAQPDSNGEVASDPRQKSNPLDAEAYAPDDSATFEALWRDRIGKR
jgi:hypothetical protein